MTDKLLLTNPESGESLYGLCGYCDRTVDNHDPHHRVTSIFDGGLGVECVHRGDITPAEAGPLGPGGDDQPNPRDNALVLCFAWEPMRLPPPWYMPGDSPACGAVLEVPAEATNDNRARRFVCDLPAGHPAIAPAADPQTGTLPLPGLGELGDITEPGRHRAVLSVDQGRVFTWPTDLGPVALPEGLEYRTRPDQLTRPGETAR